MAAAITISTIAPTKTLRKRRDLPGCGRGSLTRSRRFFTADFNRFPRLLFRQSTGALFPLGSHALCGGGPMNVKA